MVNKGVHDLKSKLEWDEVLKLKNTLVVLNCSAAWCGSCKTIQPEVMRLSSAYPQARFYKLDVDDVPEIAQELEIRNIPTFSLFQNGGRVAEVIGANPKALEAAIKSNTSREEAAA